MQGLIRSPIVILILLSTLLYTILRGKKATKSEEIPPKLSLRALAGSAGLFLYFYLKFSMTEDPTGGGNAFIFLFLLLPCLVFNLFNFAKMLSYERRTKSEAFWLLTCTLFGSLAFWIITSRAS